ncbi:MAG: hypothetical protein J6W73_05380 [Verrucomicrobia bacterium]|nr:hypothetical protein [Verrucomicrobiota bacterium]
MKKIISLLIISLCCYGCVLSCADVLFPGQPLILSVERQEDDYFSSIRSHIKWINEEIESIKRNLISSEKGNSQVKETDLIVVDDDLIFGDSTSIKDINMLNERILNEKSTKLHKIVVNEDSSVMKREIKSLKKYLNSKDRYDLTPLMLASMLGKRDMVEILLKEGADPRITYGGPLQQKTETKYLISMGDAFSLVYDYDTNIIQQFLDVKAPVDYLLLRAIKEDRSDIVKLLLDKSPQVDLNKKHYACYYCYKVPGRKLIEKYLLSETPLSLALIIAEKMTVDGKDAVIPSFNKRYPFVLRHRIRLPWDEEEKNDFSVLKELLKKGYDPEEKVTIGFSRESQSWREDFEKKEFKIKDLAVSPEVKELLEKSKVLPHTNRVADLEEIDYGFKVKKIYRD